jgi:hypothetical protein
MLDNFKQAIEDYKDTHTPLQLAGDALPYLIAVVAVVLIFRWYRRRRVSN